MKAQVHITVVPALDRPKCPRCWAHNGIPENHEGMCDRCQRQVKAGIDDYVKLGKMSREEGEALRAAILENEKMQVAKYRAEA